MHFEDVPLEVIQYIFNLCCGRVTIRIPQSDGSQSRNTQVNLSLVCSRWREIVLNTRALWADVAVIYDTRRKQESPASFQLEVVQSWLNRAGKIPISLTITVFEAQKLQIAAISQTLLSSFLIKNLDLRLNDCPVLIPTNNSHCLESLRLVLYEPDTDVFPRFPEMPSLKELELSLDPEDFIIGLTNLYTIPWHQLRVFILSKTPWSSQTLLDILQRCSSLVNCTLLVTQGYANESDIILPNLESLVLGADNRDSANPIFRSLTLPNLKSLDIRSLRRQAIAGFSPVAIGSMAQRSGFKYLTDFSLCFSLYPVDVGLLLRSMPALKSVKIHGPLMFQPGTFDDLSSGRIVPQLEELYFGVMSDEEIDLLLATIGQRHKQAKTMSDIRPFAYVTCHCTSRSDIDSHNQRAKQCGEAFNANVAILEFPASFPDDHLLDSSSSGSGDSDSDFSAESVSDEDLSSDHGIVFVSDGESLEESNSGEESHSSEDESESNEESHSFEDPSPEEQLFWSSDSDLD